MKTRVKRVRGATEEEVKAKQFNIYLGISLGNKWFTKENIRKYVLWALKYTKLRVGILIADTLHAINYEVRNKMSREAAHNRAIKKGQEMLFMIKEIINELPEKQRRIIDIMMWDDVENSPSNLDSRKICYEEFKKNPKFRKEILNMVKIFVDQSHFKKFTEEEIKKLAQYILDELPEVVDGFHYKGTYYNAYLYPHDSLLTQFSEKLQKRKIFPELHDKLSIKNNVFIQLEILS